MTVGRGGVGRADDGVAGEGDVADWEGAGAGDSATGLVKILFGAGDTCLEFEAELEAVARGGDADFAAAEASPLH